MSSLASPERIWWKPLSRHERIWVALSFATALVIFGSIFLWMRIGEQDIPTETYTVTSAQFTDASSEMVWKYQIRTEDGVPVVRPPGGSDVYLVAKAWQWTPLLELQKGQTYRLHLSSADYMHGFSLQPGNLNLEVLPGYDYVATITPDKAGEYTIICNEYCGPGHQLMVSKLVVTEN